MFTDKISCSIFNLLLDLLRVVSLRDLPCPAQEIDDREVRDVLGIGIGMALTPLDLFRIQAGLEIFYKSALAGSRITHDGEDRHLALLKIGDGFLQLGHLHLSSDEIGPHAG